jgi:hypothetical protein
MKALSANLPGRESPASPLVCCHRSIERTSSYLINYWGHISDRRIGHVPRHVAKRRPPFGAAAQNAATGSITGI